MASAKVGFVLLSNRRKPAPSTRIAVLNMLPYLHEAGFETDILFEPQGATETPDLPDLVDSAVARGIDIVYFQKVRGPRVLDAVKRLAAHGIRTIYGVCDLIENDMAAATDATVVVTDYLRGLYDSGLRHKIHVVHDGIENRDRQVGAYRPDGGSRRNPLNAVLVTSSELLTIPAFGRSPPYIHVNVVGNYAPRPWVYSIRRRYWQCMARRGLAERGRFLRDAIRRDFTKTNWDIEAVYDVMAASDIGIIPVDMSFDPLPGQDVSSWQVKSENRLTMKMAMGLPVIASPVPSYESVIVQGENGYLARSREEWLACFDALRDPERRRIIGENARRAVLDRFSKARQSEKLVAIFRQLSDPKEAACSAGTGAERRTDGGDAGDRQALSTE